MARDPKYDILFEPIQLGPKTMKNRFYQIPHCNGFGSEKPMSQAYFRAMKAEGGYGACCTEYCSIHPESDDTHRVSARLWDDDDIKNLGLMCDMLHEHGALAAAELWYGGPHAPCMESRCVPRAPSQIPSDFEHLTYPKEMDKDDIREVQGFYVAAAKRAREAGFDIVYVYGSHSYLPQQFLTPYYNRRTDEYGGSLENRLRYPLEVFRAIRAVWPDERPISVRISATDWVEGGIAGPESVEIARAFAEAGADAIHVSTGQTSPDAKPVYGRAYQTPFSDRIRNEVGVATIAVGNITEADQVNAIVAAGRADLCALARPHLADAAWTLHVAAEQGWAEQWWPPQYLTGKQQLERNLAKKAAQAAELAEGGI